MNEKYIEVKSDLLDSSKLKKYATRIGAAALFLFISSTPLLNEYFPLDDGSTKSDKINEQVSKIKDTVEVKPQN